MADKAWKQFERDSADLIGGKRKWANSGERLDVESEFFIGQCKLVQRLSLAELTALAVEMRAAIPDKFGVVFTKLRAGKGKRTPILVTMEAEEFRLLIAGCKSVMQVHFAVHEQLNKKQTTDDRQPETPPVQCGPRVPGDPAGEAEVPRGPDPAP